MKKHIVGLAIFSFIVGAAAIIYAAFNVSKTIQVAEVVSVSAASQNDSSSKSTSYWNMRRVSKEANLDEPVITQAVFDAKTKKLVWRLSSLKEEKPTVIHLFLADKKGVKKIDSFYAQELSGNEGVDVSPQVKSILNKVSPDTNLYIIAVTRWEQRFTDNVNEVKEFDSTKAFPVTIDYGK